MTQVVIKFKDCPFYFLYLGVGTLSQSAKVELLLNGHESLVVHFTYNHVMERTHDGGFFKLENGEVNENFDIYLTCGQGIYGSCTKLRLIFHLKKLTVWMRKDLPYKVNTGLSIFQIFVQFKRLLSFNWQFKMFIIYNYFDVIMFT